MLFRSDKIEKFIPPKKGLTHILRIIRELIDFKPESQKTNIAEALRFLTNAMKKRCTAFLISDFMDTGFEDALRIAGRKHDLAALHIIDERDLFIPDMGIARLYSKETGKTIWADTGSASLRNAYASNAQKHLAQIGQSFLRSGVDVARFYTGQDYVKPLLGLFKAREFRH